MSVHKKLMKARVALQTMELKKSGNNKFAGYQYFELGDFLPQVQELFETLGLCGVISFTSELATLTITDIDDGSTLSITSPMGSAALKGCHEVQNIGAVETYQRRYLWVTIMEIVEHDALDATTGDSETAASKPAQKTPQVTLAAAKDALGKAKTLEQLKKAWDATPNEHRAALVQYKDEIKSLIETVKEAA